MRFNGEKQATSSGCNRCDECAGMQRVMIFFSLQRSWKSTEQWLSWPSMISILYTPTGFACASKCSSQASARLLFVQPVGLTLITQSRGRSSVNQLEIGTLPAKMRKCGITRPVAPAPCTRVTHSRSPCCSFFRRPGFSEPVTTS